jgi:hypothetical protein
MMHSEVYGPFIFLHTLVGGGSGVAAGIYRFATTPSLVQGTETMKLKANRMLNSVGETNISISTCLDF